jgi:hypothetical protein
MFNNNNNNNNNNNIYEYCNYLWRKGIQYLVQINMIEL